MENESLQTLVKQAMGGSIKALEELCRCKCKDILYICIQLMGNVQDGEDASQEVLMALQKNITTLQSAQAFSSWLYRLTLNICNGHRRKTLKYRYAAPLEECDEDLLEESADYLPQSYIENTEKTNRVLRAIQSLPYNYRVSLLLYYYEDLSYQEIAAAMDTTERAVANCLLRAKKAVKKKLESTDTASTQQGEMLMAAPLFTAVLKGHASKTVGNTMQTAFLGGHPLPIAGVEGAAAAESAFTAKNVLLTLGATLLFFAPILLRIGISSAHNKALPPSSATDTVMVPQLSQANVAEEERKDKPEDVSAGDTAEVSSQQNARRVSSVAGGGPKGKNTAGAASSGAEPAVPNTTVPSFSGRVLFKKADDTVLEDAAHYATGMVVCLLKNKTEVQTAMVQPNGSYTFEGAVVEREAEYTLLLRADTTSKQEFEQKPKGDEIKITLAPGKAPDVLPAFYITDTKSPTVGVSFYGDDGNISLVNPQTVKIKIGDITATTLVWEILGEETGEQIDTGTEPDISDPLKKLHAKGQRGCFILHITASDEAGNTTVITQKFYIA